ncbi:AAA family ATPase [Microlunatus sp. GCM10028923]|uniref:helix-turn-helix transcriptional regulator n=1 Tax=Microlunatus sp. GCM10028923 TaxID=3273400 RepID=UPI0036199C12
MTVTSPDSPSFSERGRPDARPLVGRERELARLLELIGQSTGRPGGLVVLSGDAGIGKSRIVAAAIGAAGESGWRVGLGQCMDLGRSPLPYLPFVELFGRLAGTEEGRLLLERHPGVRPLIARTVDGTAPEPDRGALFESVHAILTDLAGARPLLLVIEDVHWADWSSLELISFLLTRPFPAPVSMIVTYRSDDLHRRHPLRPVATGWIQLHTVERLELGPLPDDAVRDLATNLRSGMSDLELARVIDRAEGNAFFTEELVAAGTVPGGVPDDLADLLILRLDQLEPAARQVVRSAAVAGRRVSHEVLQAVTELDPAELDLALRNAVERFVLISDRSDTYAFRHALLAEAVYQDLLPGERVRLHARYVAALRDHPRATAADLARHARSAHDHPTAITAGLRAAEESMTMGGPDEAVHHYLVVLELLADPQVDPAIANPVDITVRTATAAVSAGMPERAVALVQDQLSQLPADADPLVRARLLQSLATAAMLTDLNIDALTLTTEAMTLVPAEPDSELRCRVLRSHAQALADRYRHDESTRWAEEALAMAERLGLPEIATDVSALLAKLQDRIGNTEASRAALRTIVADARARGDATELRALYHLAGIHYELGEVAEALDLYRAGADRAAETGRRYAPYGIDARIIAGVAAYTLGRWDQVLEIVDTTGERPPMVADAALAAIAMYVAAGRGEQSGLALLGRAGRATGTDAVVSLHAGGAAMELYGQTGDLDRAWHQYRKLTDEIDAAWTDVQAKIRLSALILGIAADHVDTTAADRQRWTDRADWLLGQVETIVLDAETRRPLGIESRAWVHRFRAERLRLDQRLGLPVDPAALVQAWRAAVTGFEDFPSVPELARSRIRLAAALRLAGAAEEAGQVAAEARAVAEQLDARPMLAELSALAPADRPGGPGVLTPREQEVLALVAEGLSNREVGLRLTISTKTASVHVSNILTKLGAGTRTEAAALARRRGLLG